MVTKPSKPVATSPRARGGAKSPRPRYDGNGGSLHPGRGLGGAATPRLSLSPSALHMLPEGATQPEVLAAEESA